MYARLLLRCRLIRKRNVELSGTATVRGRFAATLALLAFVKLTIYHAAFVRLMLGTLVVANVIVTNFSKFSFFQRSI
ncbi:hypothetical protein BDV96DRAFT_592328 [Lophiotrema nucula]|uniref:Uncharacterized protein n=1 Tax=Lophiotrema nucula TaxID=690887 RepID=A0A6A5YEN8_9PLEO|nr:hypothetical protein BDV96DRAFT_592328 [Lophiotrema nucula]